MPELPVMMDAPAGGAGGDPGIESGLLFGGVEPSTLDFKKETKISTLCSTPDQKNQLISNNMIIT